MSPSTFFSLAKETFNRWNEDKASRLAAALAYYTIFSLAPLLIVVLAIAGAVFGADAARDRLDNEIRGLVGQQGAEFIQEMVNNANQPAAGMIATIIGVVTLLLGAAGVFGQLQDALNTVWGVVPKPRGLLGTIQQRFISFAMVLGVGFLLLVSLVLSALLAALDGWLNAQFPGGGIILRVINLVVSLVVITGVFAMIFKYLPDAEITWRDVGVGAFVTAVLFNIGKYLIGLYLGSSSVASVYGAAGSLVILLLWIYYSAQILLLGAEFTKVYALRFGSKIRASDNAVPMTYEARAREGMPTREQVDTIVRARDPQQTQSEHALEAKPQPTVERFEPPV
jgi:membrane protein